MMGLLTPITDAISAVGSTITQPLKDVMIRKEERKQAHQTASVALRAAREANAKEITLGDQQLEHILAAAQGGTWKDEYVTLSVVGIINAVILGGIASAMGYPQVLDGVVLGVTTLTAAGVDVGFLLNATVTSAIG